MSQIRSNVTPVASSLVLQYTVLYDTTFLWLSNRFDRVSVDSARQVPPCHWLHAGFLLLQPCILCVYVAPHTTVCVFHIEYCAAIDIYCKAAKIAFLLQNQAITVVQFLALYYTSYIVLQYQQYSTGVLCAQSDKKSQIMMYILFFNLETNS